MYVGAASQHVLRMSFVPEHEARTFDTEVIGFFFWSQLIKRDATSHLFHLGGLGVRLLPGELGNRFSQHSWQPLSPQMQTLSSAPNLCDYKPLSHNRGTSLPSSSSSLLDQPSAPTPPRRGQSPPSKKHLHKQLLESHATSPISRAILLSQSAPHTGDHLLQLNSEAYESEDHCFRVSVARRLMLPAASDPSGVVCGKSVDAHQHHCNGSRYGGGVDRRCAAVARCLADVIHTHSGTKVYIEQAIPALEWPGRTRTHGYRL